MTELTEFGQLRGARITAQLPRPDMERRIAAFLRHGNVCVLATCLNDVPRATPIEYYSDGLTIFVAASRATKIKNLEGNPRVGVAIYSTPYTDWTDWYRVIGLQMTARFNCSAITNSLRPTQPRLRSTTGANTGVHWGSRTGNPARRQSSKFSR